MHYRHLSILTLLFMVFAVAGCQQPGSPSPGNHDKIQPSLLFKPVQYTEFQWTILSQGQLILINDAQYLWPARLQSTEILESYPPKVRLLLHHEDRQLTHTINSLVSPRAVDHSAYQAEVYEKEKWRQVRTFRLQGLQFEYRESEDGNWLTIAASNIRFIKR